MAPVLGLCALLAADAVLIAWAFRGTPTDPGEAAVSGVIDSWWVVLGDRVHRAEQPGGPWEPTGSPLDG